MGDAEGALELFEALLPDVERVLGAEHPDTLSTRAHIAYWTGETGDPRRALELFEAVLSRITRIPHLTNKRDFPSVLEAAGPLQSRAAVAVGDAGNVLGPLGLAQASADELADFGPQLSRVRS